MAKVIEARLEQLEREQLATLLGVSVDADKYNTRIYEQCMEYKKLHAAQYNARIRKIRKEQLYGASWLSIGIRRNIQLLIEHPAATRRGQVFVFVQTLLVLGSIAQLVAESHPSLNPQVRGETAAIRVLNDAEFGFSVYFTVETLLLFWASDEKLKLIKRPTFVADVVSLVPFYVQLIFHSVGNSLDALRVLRLFRVTKFLRNLRAIDDLIVALEKSFWALVGPLIFLTATVLFMSAAMYYTEKGTWDPVKGDFFVDNCQCEATSLYAHEVAAGRNATDVCPLVPTRFVSIPRTLWWAIVTLTTVGYGDLVPVCASGRAVAVLGMVLAVLFMAMPIAIVGSYFTLVVEESQIQKAALKREIAAEAKQMNYRTVQLAMKRQLNTLTEAQLRVQCHRHQLVKGSVDEMCARLYEYYNVKFEEEGDPERQRSRSGHILSTSPSPSASPRSLAQHYQGSAFTVAEMLIEYLRERLGVEEEVSIKNPSIYAEDVVHSFFQRIYVAMNVKAGIDVPPSSTSIMGHRLERTTAGVTKIVPFCSRATYYIGVACEGVPDPDIILKPARICRTSVCLAPRMAKVHVIEHFFETLFILVPVQPFVPMVNGTSVSSRGILLEPGDCVDFGSSEYPMEYYFELEDFAVLDPFASSNETCEDPASSSRRPFSGLGETDRRRRHVSDVEQGQHRHTRGADEAVRSVGEAGHIQQLRSMAGSTLSTTSSSNKKKKVHIDVSLL